jgi:hypothetical protein
LTIAVAVAVAAVVVLAFLPRSVTAKDYGSPFSFDTFYLPAESSRATTPEQPWTAVAAVGLALPSAEGGTIGTEGFGGGGCTPSWTSNSSVEVPATRPDPPAGEVSGWILFSTDPQGNVLLTVASNNSGILDVTSYLIVPETCFSDLTPAPPLGGSIVDSIAAAQVADSNGGASFLADNSGVTQELVAWDGLWTITYTTCGYGSTSGSGQQFVAIVNATSGALELPPVAGSAPCGS